MKKLNILITLIIAIGISLSLTSCIVMTRHDNGHHKGWYKSPQQSHPASSKPGRGKH
jgi:ABC-type lipoprotein release transport system permease subunit